MLIRVYVTPNAREARVVKVSDNYFEVRVDEMAVGGRANKRLREILAEHFKVQKSRISILKGTKTRNKLVQVILSNALLTRHCNPSKFPIGAGLFLPFRETILWRASILWPAADRVLIMVTVSQPPRRMDWRAKRRKRLTNGQNQDSQSSQSSIR